MNCELYIVFSAPWWNPITYVLDTDTIPPCGSRVRVSLHNTERVGFVLGVGSDINSDKHIVKQKKIIEVLDNASILGNNIWNLALWTGRHFLCGAGEVLKAISPAQLLNGDPVILGEKAFSEKGFDKHKVFIESECYSPYDSERFDFYMNRLVDSALILFPERSVAKHFYDSLPSELKNCALLWGNKASINYWQDWLNVRNGNIKYVIGAPSAVYAPLPNISLVIVEDEANPAYVSKRYPNLPIRSIAGKLAFFSEAELVLGGRLPSAKTYMRKKVKCNYLPDKDLLHFVNIKDGFSATVQGIEKAIPISKTLVSETKKCLNENMTVLWIYDRKGYAIEVLCENCGHGVFCNICGAVMTAKNIVFKGKIDLYCRRCSNRKKLPESCPVCHGSFFVGKRPGLEALETIADALSEHEFKEATKSSGTKKLIVGTRKILSLCDNRNVGLVAWIDIDQEANRADYTSRFNTFSMVWESLWRGIKKSGVSGRMNVGKNRRVIIQSRSPAKGWQIGLKSGWQYFWDKELLERAELELPPYKPLVEIEVSMREAENLVKLLEDNFYMAMGSPDPEDGNYHIWLSTSSLSSLGEVLSSRFSISNSRYGYPRVKVFVE
jgi:primosomal protein N' (replication factor Y)